MKRNCARISIDPAHRTHTGSCIGTRRFRPGWARRRIAQVRCRRGRRSNQPCVTRRVNEVGGQARRQVTGTRSLDATQGQRQGIADGLLAELGCHSLSDDHLPTRSQVGEDRLQPDHSDDQQEQSPDSVGRHRLSRGDQRPEQPRQRLRRDGSHYREDDQQDNQADRPAELRPPQPADLTKRGDRQVAIVALELGEIGLGLSGTLPVRSSIGRQLIEGLSDLPSLGGPVQGYRISHGPRLHEREHRSQGWPAALRACQHASRRRGRTPQTGSAPATAATR